MYSPNVIYHVYNQSINFEPLFRSEENYLFFLNKIRTHLLPVADILCYCLMPDHFHLMLKPKPDGCAPSNVRRLPKAGESPGEVHYQQELSHQIKIMLSSYTRAFNKRYNRRGSLFKGKTKAKPGYQDFVAEHHEFSVEAPFTRYVPYLRTCFYYIHENPVKAHYALSPEEWPFSSAADYANLREGTLCNYALAEHLLGITRKPF